jgi:hypothetical protein
LDSAPEPIVEHQSVAPAASTESTTGKPVAKEAEDDVAPPPYTNEGVVAPAEKTEVVQGEEVKAPTTEVSVDALAEGWKEGPELICPHSQTPDEADAHKATEASS